MTATRALLDKWREALTVRGGVADALARGDAKHSQHAAPSDTLGRCAEMLADALQADAANEYVLKCEIADAAERERQLERRTDRDFRPTLTPAFIPCGGWGFVNPTRADSGECAACCGNGYRASVVSRAGLEVE